LVLLAAGSPRVDFNELPLLAAAFAAGCVVDLSSSLVRMRLAGVVPELKLQMKVIGLVWAVDAALAPLGFLAAIVGRRHDLAILFVLPLAFLLALLARDRSQRIEQAHHRLKLVEQERARLQSAVRRLGDAFAAKLDLVGLLEILLHGSVEALDAAAGRLELDYSPSPVSLAAGAEPSSWLPEPEGRGSGSPTVPVQIGHAGTWRLTVPMRIAASPEEIAGWLSLSRDGRAFEEDEVALIVELIGKAGLSAADIIANQALREQAMTDSLTGLGNRRRLSCDLSTVFENAGSASPSLLLLFDLDGFKDYNDTFGHLAGDNLLARLGAKLQMAVDGFGRAYRLGGDEFCAHLQLDGGDSDALILQAAAAFTQSGGDSTIEASLGVVLLPLEAASAEDALQLADERMYANKRSRSTAARSQAGEVLVRTLCARQPELDRHSTNVAELAGKVARRLGLSGEVLDDVSSAAQLHDIGKVGIPDSVLLKPGSLSPEERAVMNTHTEIGGDILSGSASELVQMAEAVARTHHERWDGSGYPGGLLGEQIPLAGRITSICDVFDALVTARVYKPAWTVAEATVELQRLSGKAFDPRLVELFIALVPTLDPDLLGHAHERVAGADAAPEPVTR
jgi:diguanylate cyclase (GGDEF)-like protein